MQKELNPDLFGSGGGSNPGNNSYSNSAGRIKDERGVPQQRVVHQLEEKIAGAQAQTKFALDQMAGLVAQVNEFIKVSQGKFDRMQASLKSMEQQAQVHNSEATQRFSHVHQRLNERKTMDAKMQEMMDRHNSILKSYEVRLNHLQTLISQKETQIQTAQISLNETKMEIARLKRL
jgi:chromosome segregation ATPase